MMIAVLVAAAWASQIFYEDVTLEAVLQRDPIVVVVEDAAPPSGSVSLPAGGTAQVARLRVVSVAQAPEGLLAPEQIIEVADANLEAMYMMASEQRDGMRRSPIFERLQAPAATAGAQRVALLRPCHVAGAALLCFAIDGAQLPLELLPTITPASPRVGAE